MVTETLAWDAADHLGDDQAIAAYLDAAFEDGDPSVIAAALGDIARARGMSSVARQTGITREGLYKALSHDGNPELGTIMKVIKALGISLSASVKDPVQA